MLTLIANSGTPLLAMGCCWLFLGNWAIGGLEAWIASRLAATRVASPLIVCANYLSAAVGVGGVWLLSRWDLSLAGYKLLVFGWVVAFGLSVAVECWFFARSLRQAGSPANPWRVALIANGVSYAILIPLTMVAGATSLWRLQVVEPKSMATVGGRAVFLDVDGRTVWSVRLDGTDRKRIFGCASPQSGVYVDPSSDGKTAFLADENGNRLLTMGTGDQAATLSVGWGDQPYRKARSMAMCARTFRVPERKGTRVSNGFWGVMGLRLSINGIWRHYALETPYVAGMWNDLTLLPDGKLIALLNQNVVLLDPATDRIAVLGTGLSASVLLDPGVSPSRNQHRIKDHRELVEHDP